MPTGGSNKRVGEALRQLAIDQLQLGATPKEMVAALGLSESFICQLRKTYKTFGTVAPPYWNKGRPKKIHTAAAEGMLDLLDQEPQSSLDDFVDLLEQEYDIGVSKSTISRKLKQLKMTYKRVERTNQAQDPELRADYYSRIVEYEAEQVVFVDESAANEHTAHSRYGWSPRGTACRVRYPGKRSRRWSILPALGLNGYIDYEIFHGSYNKERFMAFIDRLMSKMNAFAPGVPRSVLIMDNAPIHSGPELQQLCDEKGVRLEFLPPYSPDLNPIEETFHELKAWMKKHRKLAEEYADQDLFEIFISIGVEAVVSRVAARGYYRHAGWSVNDLNDDIEYSTLIEVDVVDGSEEVEVEV